MISLHIWIIQLEYSLARKVKGSWALVTANEIASFSARVATIPVVTFARSLEIRMEI